VQYGKARLELIERLARRRNEHVAYEKAVPRGFAHHAYGQPELRVGAGIGILNE
jgi:hypothetical protein